MAIRKILIVAAFHLAGISNPCLAADESPTLSYWRFEDAMEGQDAIQSTDSIGREAVSLRGGPAYHRPDGSKDVPTTKIPNPDIDDRMRGKNTGSIEFVGPREVDGKWTGTDYLFAESAPAWEFGANQGFTIEGWIKLSDLPSEGVTYVLSKYGAPPNPIGYSVMVKPEGQLMFRVMTESGGRSVTSQETIPPGKWTHFAVRRNSFGDIDVYLDGDFSGVETGFADSLENEGKLFLGARDDITLGSHLHGVVDEIRISSGALDPKDFLISAE